MMIFPYLITPWLPTNCDAPPTLYALMNSICNFGKVDKTNIYNLAKGSREVIFDFPYPLSDKVNKEDFECMILNHYIMRRIGFDTPTGFKLALNVKLNEIMPLYNKLFDALDGWDILNDGEVIDRTLTNNGNNSVNTSVNSVSSNVSDRRNSNVPQNQLYDIQSGNYMTDYNLDTDNASGNTSSTSDASSSNLEKEITKTSPKDRVKTYKEFIESRNNIYTMIFKDLDDLFYTLV